MIPWSTARRVELLLPQTGVCSTKPVEAAASACCGAGSTNEPVTAESR